MHGTVYVLYGLSAFHVLHVHLLDDVPHDVHHDVHDDLHDVRHDLHDVRHDHHDDLHDVRHDPHDALHDVHGHHRVHDGLVQVYSHR